MITIIGIAAAIITTFQFLPQAMTAWRHRDDAEAMSGLSVPTFALVVTSATLWIAYSAARGDWPLLVPNIFCLGTGLLTVTVACRGRVVARSVEEGTATSSGLDVTYASL